MSTTYRGYQVWELPPPGQGIAALQMLNILSGYNLKKMGPQSADYWCSGQFGGPSGEPAAPFGSEIGNIGSAFGINE